MSERWDEVIAAWQRRLEQLDALAASQEQTGATLDAGEEVPEWAKAAPEPPVAAPTEEQRAALAGLLARSRHIEERLARQQAAISGELGELGARRQAARGYASHGRA